MKRLLGFTAVILLVSGCIGLDDVQGPPGRFVPFDPGQSLAALVSAEGCDDLLETLQEQAIAFMEQRLDQNLQTAIEYGGYWCWDYAVEDGQSNGTSGAPPPGNHDGQRASEYSETNVQVQGVDEADFVKNDGEYIYILANGRFQIIDAWPPDEAHVISQFEVEGLARKMFVHADRVVIYSSKEYLLSDSMDPFGGYGVMVDGTDNYDECTYGYYCDFTGDNRALKVTVLDIADRSNPALLREIDFSGSLVNARRINNAVFTVVSFPPTALAGVQYWPEELWYYCDGEYSEAELITLFEALREANREIIEATTISDWIPGAVDVRYIDGEPIREEGLLASCDDFYLSQQKDGQNYLSLTAFDMTEQGAIDVTTVFGRPGAVYASATSLYVASRHQQSAGEPWFYEDSEIAEASTVHKFDLVVDSASTFYAGSGVVKGRVLNQFAMDEWQGNFRIATTTGHVPSPDVHSTVTILQEHGGQMRLVGILDDIAPTEDIRAVRFDGARGFVVTFKKTDPLFAIDLSDPANPTIEGELHIPGYSTYMHLMDENHLLAMGYDAQDEGNFAWFQGVLLQIFDISDMANPTLTHREVIGSRGSTSEAATNHLAFNFFKPRNWLAIPMVICEGGHDGSYGTQMTFGGLMVYKVTPSDGFEYLGGVPHLEAETEESSYSACSNWWTDSNSYVQRSIFMDDYVFSIAANSIEVALVSNPGEVLASVDLVEEP